MPWLGCKKVFWEMALPGSGRFSATSTAAMMLKRGCCAVGHNNMKAS